MIDLMHGITPESLKARREETGLGLDECRRAMMRENALAIIDRATSVDELKDVLRELVRTGF